MPTPQKTHNLALCTCSINGERLEGFGEHEAVSIEESSDTLMVKVGADGQPTVSVSNDKGLTATINVMANSRAAQTLRRQQLEQQAEIKVGPIQPRPFLLIDPLTGHRVSSRFSSFLNEPFPSFAKEITTLEYKVYLPNAKSDSMLVAPDVTV